MAVTQQHDPQLDAGAAAGPPSGETSLLGRFVALLTPVFVVGAAWVAGVVAHAVPGAHLDQNQVVTFMAAAATAALTAAWKWLQGWQQHERMVAEGKEPPRGRPRAR
jgi:hypothetical protein